MQTTTREPNGSAISFRWHPPNGEMLLPISPLLLRALGVRVTDDDPRVAALRGALFEGDPLADAVVAWMRSTTDGEARAMFERAVTQGIGAVHRPPPPLAALFDEIERVPTWVDRRAISIGADTLLRVGRSGIYALGSASLMSGYLSSGAVKPLVGTGALTRQTRRRLAETATYFRDLATSGDMPRFSPGFMSSVRVRVLHAQIRAAQRNMPTWNAAAWGVPINQRDMIGTHLEFTVAFIGGLTALGYLISKRERESLMHLWRYVAMLIGIREDLVPRTFKEGLEVAWVFNATEKGPDDDGRRLARALLDAWATGAAHQGELGKLEGRFLCGLSRFILGDRASDALGLPDGPWKYAPLAAAPIRGAIEVLRLLVPGGHRLAIRRGRAILESDVARAMRDA